MFYGDMLIIKRPEE